MKHINLRAQTFAAAQPQSGNSSLGRVLNTPAKNTGIKPVIPLTILAFTAALGASLPAHAEVQKGQFEVSPFIGYHFFESEQNLENDLTYGIRFGYSFTRHWAVEGAVSTIGTNVDDATISGASEGQFRSPADEVDLLLYLIDALYHFRPDNKFSPYVVGGYGAADYSPSISSEEMSTFNLGVGAKYWVADNLALRFEVRDHLVGEVFDHSYNNISATFGVSFAFGGNEPAKPYQAATPESQPTTVAEPIEVEDEVEADIAVLEFDDIHFSFDDATLSDDAQRSLRQSIATLQENPNSKVRIAGFTSAAGSDEHNQALSEKRANAIKNHLVSSGGIAEKRLSVVGYGSKRPAAHESSPQNLQSAAAKENMRALFEIVID